MYISDLIELYNISATYGHTVEEEQYSDAPDKGDIQKMNPDSRTTVDPNTKLLSIAQLFNVKSLKICNPFNARRLYK